ncbi:MAG: putative DNA primase/helicase [Oleiphilaceae bacterium]|jgi:putative DNA primase/helicase
MSNFNLDITKRRPVESNYSAPKLHEFLTEAYKAAEDCDLYIHGPLQDTGDFVRTPTKAKPHKLNGVYIYNSESQFFYAHNYDADRTNKVFGSGAINNTQHQRNRKELAQKTLELAMQKKQQAAIDVHRWISQSTPVITHPYVERKQIIPFGSYLFNDHVLIPVLSEDGALSSCQLIASNGQKRFKSGGRIKGGRYLIGDITSATTLLICEGYATACSLHEATNLPVMIVFSAGNFRDVCVSLRKCYPTCRLVICSDNDHIKQAPTGINTGVKATRLAAKASGARLIIPQFTASDTGTDFNDIHCTYGLEALTTLLSNELRGI